MPTYTSTFVSGLQEPARDSLEQCVPSVKVLHTLDGLISYRLNKPIDVDRLRFANNTFLLLRLFDKPASIEAMIADTLKSNDWEAALQQHRVKGRTFRIVTSLENHLVSVDKGMLARLEQRIVKVHGLSVHRSKPDIEFWLLLRREGIGFFMQRLTKHRAHEKVLHKGELRPELANLLCFLSNPADGDVFLDPFCGYGAIPFERAVCAPYRAIYATDQDLEKIEFLKQKASSTRFRQSVVIRTMDALRLSPHTPGSIDKIVTDPPWGLYEAIEGDVATFYSQMLQEFHRVLRPDGTAVVLTARDGEFSQGLDQLAHLWRDITRYDVLVSGKKASVYKMKRVE